MSSGVSAFECFLGDIAVGTSQQPAAGDDDEEHDEFWVKSI